MASKKSSRIIYGFLLLVIFLCYFISCCLAARKLEVFPQNNGLGDEHHKDDDQSKTNIHSSRSKDDGSANGDDTANGAVNMPPPGPYERNVDHYHRKEKSDSKTNNSDGSQSEVITSNDSSGYRASTRSGNKGQTITRNKSTKNQTIIEKNHQNAGNNGVNEWNANNPAYFTPTQDQQYPLYPPPMCADPNCIPTTP